jgi:HrpA-like RNA helicase
VRLMIKTKPGLKVRLMTWRTVCASPYIENPMFNREPAASWVLPLHSTVPPEDQRKVFTHAPPGRAVHVEPMKPMLTAWN